MGQAGGLRPTAAALRLVSDQFCPECSEVSKNVVTAYEAKTNLARLLERVGRGERITITRHGVPVAELVPARGRPAQEIKDTIEALRRFRKGRRLEGVSLRELIEEGRR